MESQNNANKETKTQKKNGKRRMKLVILFIVLIAIIGYISFRGNYLEILEISEKYTDIFWQNLQYNGITIAINFIFLFIFFRLWKIICYILMNLIYMYII